MNLALKKTMCDYKVEVVFLINPYVLYFRTAVFLRIPRVLNQSEDFGMFKLHIYMSMNVMNFYGSIISYVALFDFIFQMNGY